MAHVDLQHTGGAADETVLYAEADLMPLSALQHLLFCERQCGLIHLEGLWNENRLTAEGRLLHEHVHEAGDEARGDVRTVRGVRLHSLELGLYGIADIVEFREAGTGGIEVPGVAGRWDPVVVEYKRGRPKTEDCDRVQLCAQAMCLEEMLNTRIAAGSIFYGQPRRREEVAFSDDLRAVVRGAAARVHELIALGTTPPGQYEPKCRNCSLVDVCLPRRQRGGASVAAYLAEAFEVAEPRAPDG